MAQEARGAGTGAEALDPQARALLDEMEEQGMPPLEQMSVPQARDAIMLLRDLAGDPEPVAGVRDLTVPGPAGELPVRIYSPSGAPEGPLPLVVYFHGGGWMIGNVELMDRPCRKLANASGCVVASVEYRLSPESKFPAPFDDCYAALGWLAGHAGEFGADPGRVAVAGDSAGGNLATAVALASRDRGGPPLAYQLLVYPVTDRDFGTASYREFADGYFLTAGSMRMFWRHYLKEEAEADSPYVSPLRAPDLSGLPPALVITAGFDPLRDEGEAYGERLADAGVEVKVSRYGGMIHGFISMSGVLDRARDLYDEIGRELRAALSA